MLTLHTTDGGTWFKPGELVDGRASWHLEEEKEGDVQPGRTGQAVSAASAEKFAPERFFFGEK